MYFRPVLVVGCARDSQGVDLGPRQDGEPRRDEERSLYRALVSSMMRLSP